MVYRAPPRDSGKGKAVCVGTVTVILEDGPEASAPFPFAEHPDGPSRRPGDHTVTDHIL